tara:strand:- start:745 stop:1089 length:345 start_codon:yes stop_codon:yes gene_type:complete
MDYIEQYFHTFQFREIRFGEGTRELVVVYGDYEKRCNFEFHIPRFRNLPVKLVEKYSSKKSTVETISWSEIPHGVIIVIREWIKKQIDSLSSSSNTNLIFIFNDYINTLTPLGA